MNTTREVIVVGSLWRATLTLSNFTEEERKRINQFGNVVVDVGGAYTFGEGGEFTLPENDRFIPQETTFIQTFSIAEAGEGGSEEAGAKAIAWAEQTETKIVNALRTHFQQDRSHQSRVITEHSLI